MNIETESPVSEFSSEIPLSGANNPKIVSGMCAKTAKNNLACRLLVTGDDSAVYLLQNPGYLNHCGECSSIEVFDDHMFNYLFQENLYGFVKKP